MPLWPVLRWNLPLPFTHPTPSSAEVKERVQLYLYSPYGPLWPVLRWTLALPFNIPNDNYRLAQCNVEVSNPTPSLHPNDWQLIAVSTITLRGHQWWCCSTNRILYPLPRDVTRRHIGADSRMCTMLHVSRH